MLRKQKQTRIQFFISGAVIIVMQSNKNRLCDSSLVAYMKYETKEKQNYTQGALPKNILGNGMVLN